MSELYLLDVRGTCMEPDVANGSRVLVSAAEAAREGDIVIYRHPRDGERHTGRVRALDGFYTHVENNVGGVCGMVSDMVEGVVLAVVEGEAEVYESYGSHGIRRS